MLIMHVYLVLLHVFEQGKPASVVFMDEISQNKSGGGSCNTMLLVSHLKVLS